MAIRDALEAILDRMNLMREKDPRVVEGQRQAKIRKAVDRVGSVLAEFLFFNFENAFWSDPLISSLANFSESLQRIVQSTMPTDRRRNYRRAFEDAIAVAIRKSVTFMPRVLSYHDTRYGEATSLFMSEHADVYLDLKNAIEDDS